jgi:hypothetical protein
MIVRPAGNAVHLITQPDHAHLARTIMERCTTLADHARRQSILHAIAEHDNGWTEEDSAPIVNPANGHIADFVGVPIEIRHRVWPRGVGRLAEPWAAALVAQHAITVYDRFRADQQWTSFFAEMAAMRDARLSESRLSRDQLVADYPFLRLGDLVSLAFCTASAGEQRFGPWAVKLTDSRVAVTPAAFGGAVVDFEIVAREIPHRSFESDLELRTALHHAVPRVLRGQVA